MESRYRIIRRGSRGNNYYCVDSATGSRTSLKTTNLREAQRLIDAKNEAAVQPMLNLQIAKAYLLGADSAIAGRTWGDAMSTLTNSKQGSNKERWERAAKDKALAAILPLLPQWQH